MDMTGQVAKISTDCAGDIVLKIIVAREHVPNNIFRYLNEMVKVFYIEGDSLPQEEL